MRFVLSEDLEPGMVVAHDIISPGRVCMLKKGITLTAEYVAYLQNKGYLGAYIVDAMSDYICVEDPISFTTLTEGLKAVENTDIDGLMMSARQIVADIAKMKELSIDIFDLRAFDDYTYHHSVNVAVYAVAVGMFLGMSEEDLTQLSQAGICHDLGKQKIPIAVINKPGRLTDEEYAEIKKHSKYSYDILEHHPEISAAVKRAVICHHENENGSGYPFGKEGSEVSLMTKILHAVDVYDALITKRPYKDPYSPVEAFDYLMGGIGILFNEEVVEAMTHVIPAYPIGTELKLSTGEAALVVAHSGNPLRPVVRVIADRRLINLDEKENASIGIVLEHSAASDNTGEVERLNEQRQAVREQIHDIMVVDDSIISLKQTQKILSDGNYRLIPLQSGAAAANFIRKNGAPDLVIMDIEMPGMDGVKTAAAIRAMGHKDLPMIFLTAKSDKETVLKCREVHAKDYIVKPVRPAYLRARVAIALDETLDR